jgi:hypothetical protein
MMIACYAVWRTLGERTIDAVSASVFGRIQTGDAVPKILEAWQNVSATFRRSGRVHRLTASPQLPVSHGRSASLRIKKQLISANWVMFRNLVYKPDRVQVSNDTNLIAFRLAHASLRSVSAQDFRHLHRTPCGTGRVTQRPTPRLGLHQGKRRCPFSRWVLVIPTRNLTSWLTRRLSTALDSRALWMTLEHSVAALWYSADHAIKVGQAVHPIQPRYRD